MWKAGRWEVGVYTVFLLSLVCVIFFGCAGEFEAEAQKKIEPMGTGDGFAFNLSVWDDSPVVRTRYGVVAGDKDEDMTWSWKGIPYAAPPTGNLRWRAPAEPEPWPDVLYADDFCEQCMQYSPVISGRLKGSEDCLGLNIWRPRSDETGLPVYVWIHGGGNSMGAADMVPDYYGHRVASRSRFVFVSVNYRLGPLGWFSHPSLRAQEDPTDASGNYGTLDLVHSLRWIRDNIDAFGGDPGNVTISGESAGGMNVLSLMISPLAEGLFHKALVQSGVPRAVSPAEADDSFTDAWSRLMESVDQSVFTAEDDAEQMALQSQLEEARSIPAEEIFDAFRPETAGMLGLPAIYTDGYVLPEEGYTLFDTGEYPGRVPLMIGSNKEETKMFLWLGGDLSWRDEAYQPVAEYGSALWKASGVDGIARRIAAHPDAPPVFAYLFSWGAPDAEGESPLPGNMGWKLGSFHSLEIPFFLGTDTINGSIFSLLVFNRRNRPGRTALQDVMMRYAANFARYGDPAPDGNTSESESFVPLPDWPRWLNGENEPKYVILDAESDPKESEKSSGMMVDVTISTQDITREQVMARMERELSGDLLERVREIIGDAWDED